MTVVPILDRTNPWVLDVGRWADGSRCLMRVPGIDGVHTLTAGASGSGKTWFNRLILMQAAARLGKNVALFVADPDMVNYVDLAPRATTVAYGEGCALDLMNLLMEEMLRRFWLMHRKKIKEWTPEFIDAIGPFLLCCFEEVQAITDAEKPKSAGPGKPAPPSATKRLISLSQRMRKAGGGLILSTQHPDADTIPTKVRGQCAQRWMGRVEEDSAVDVVFGKGRPISAGHVDESRPGTGYFKVGGVIGKCRIDGFDDESAKRLAEWLAADRVALPGFPNELYDRDIQAVIEGNVAA